MVPGHRSSGRGTGWLVVLSAVLLAAGASAMGPAGAAAAAPPSGSWITFNGGHLAYGVDGQGNRIPDYSYAGYENGGVTLPVVPTVVSVRAPTGTDDTAAIQAAIDQVSSLPLSSAGFRGAVQLGAGQYQIGGTLNINASGVVLRGATATATDTELVTTGGIRTLIQVGGQGGSYTPVGTTHYVADRYVPVGAMSMNLDSTVGFAVGDQVVIQRPQTAAWLSAIGEGGLWSPGPGLFFERTITAMTGSQITVDGPITTALDQGFEQSPVYHYNLSRIDHVGIENLSSDGLSMSRSAGYSTGFYSANFTHFNAVQNSWMLNVVTYHYGQDGVVGLAPLSRRNTILDTRALDMITNVSTSAGSAGYTLQGQQNLVKNCVVSTARIHAFVTQNEQAGPNVFSNCSATTTAHLLDSGGHQKWGSGTLWDDITIQGTLLLVDNGSRGTNHGWSDANSTAWNCNTSTGHQIQDPPTAHNWSVGCTGPLLSGSNGEIESDGQNVMPASLYDEQLAERLGGTPGGPLGAATGLAASSLGGGNVMLTWSPPSSNGGSPITAYAVFMYGQDGSSSTAETTSSGSFTASGLIPGTQYTFTVTPWNGMQWGPWSQWSNWVQA